MLSSKELIKYADIGIKKHPEAFEALLEFERTGKVPKFNKKMRVNFTIDPAVEKKFKEYCKKNSINMSAKIEQFMKEELSKYKGGS